jgi:serine/threonine protein kinase
MAARRQVMAPPHIDGYTHLRHLGSGGFAEVFLYQQQHPRQEVAVKVLTEEGLDEESRRQFTAEANTMAELSSHPFIVPVMGAGVTGAGHPYIIMKYYPQPNLAVQARRQRFSVPDVLRIGVQIASAIETAHRAGILHRDIKPANLLTDSYGAPGLADFGIAATKSDSENSSADALSLPWAPPESLPGGAGGGPSGGPVVDAAAWDERADVYSLGATLWHLLAGHSPYYEPGGDNTMLPMMHRIRSPHIPRVSRTEVPESLQRFLRQMLAKSPDGRPQSALAVAHGLRAIEQEQRLPMTPLALSAGLVDAGPGRDADEEDATRVRPAVVEAQPRRTAPRPVYEQPAYEQPGYEQPTREQTTRHGEPKTPAADAGPPAGQRTRASTPTGAALDATVRPSLVRSQPQPDTEPVAQDEGKRGRLGLVVVAVIGVAVIVAVVVALVGQGGGGTPTPSPTATIAPQNPVNGANVIVPGTPTVTGKLVDPGHVTFTWNYDDAQPGDTFHWQRDDAGATPSAGVVTTPTLDANVTAGQQACLQVRVFRSTGGLASLQSTVVCA